MHKEHWLVSTCWEESSGNSGNVGRGGAGSDHTDKNSPDVLSAVAVHLDATPADANAVAITAATAAATAAAATAAAASTAAAAVSERAAARSDSANAFPGPVTAAATAGGRATGAASGLFAPTALQAPRLAPPIAASTADSANDHQSRGQEGAEAEAEGAMVAPGAYLGRLPFLVFSRFQVAKDAVKGRHIARVSSCLGASMCGRGSCRREARRKGETRGGLLQLHGGIIPQGPPPWCCLLPSSTPFTFCLLTLS